ncbi:MAG: ABC transporter substrate-binding protein [Opitutia bacterium Tous-C1TDCM]|nr:MAG: ABC transporter substrate-binding protein [Opitutae bacterium Tous-C1TDCM]PAW70928.1 MAG: ABC transporter substrate-binding protein [Verrucomicrobiae bacterium Tous-C4TDCM]
MNRRSFLHSGLATAAVVALPGCGKRESSVDRGNREQILHRGIGYEVSELDPHLVVGLAEGEVLRALAEGLVGEDPVDLHPVPAVAERWDVSPDGLVYTFYLRANAKWSNGDPVTAADFVTSYRRILTPSLAADYANLLYILQGAEAFHKAATKDFASVGAKAVDDRTLRLTLEHPAAYFVAMLPNPPWLPVHLPTIRKHGPEDKRGNPWTKPENIVTNGPFVLQQWRQNQIIVAEKSPLYWDAAKVRLNAVHFYPVESVDAEERMFRAGQLHLTETVPISKIEAYRRDSPQLIRSDPYLGSYFYRFNTRRAPFTDVRIRRALALGVDRQVIAAKILKGGEQPATAYTPPGTAGYTPAAKVPTDFAAARQLLKAAGFEGGKGLPPVEILFNTSENHKLVAEAVQEMWRRELGVDARLVNQEQKVVLASRRAGDYQVLRSNWIGDYIDPSTFLDIFRTDSGNNYTGWGQPDYDAALFAAARTADPAARFALFQKAEALLLEQAPIIPIYWFTHTFLKHPAVKGWNPTLLDHHPYKHVWLEP